MRVGNLAQNAVLIDHTWPRRQRRRGLSPAAHRHEPIQPPGQPRIRQALPASTSFVLALAHCGR
jgi:hypothetical protein